MRAANGIGSSTSTNFHHRTPAAKNIAAPSAAVITAVPRLGSFTISPTGTSTAISGGIRNSGLPIRSHDARWNHDASASTSAIFISSDGWICKPPNSIQRCAPLPICP